MRSIAALSTRVAGTLRLAAFAAIALPGASPLCAAAEPPAAWQTAATIPLEGLLVSLSKPVLVARSKGYLWFPTMIRLSGDELFAILSTSLDAFVADRTAAVTWSGDGGLTWSPLSSIDPKADLYAESTLRLPNGDELLYPFNLYPRPGGMGGSYQIVSGQKGKHEVRLVKGGADRNRLASPGPKLQ